MFIFSPKKQGVDKNDTLQKQGVKKKRLSYLKNTKK